ncbi:MAG: LytTR family transcriptional regulator DNA-binding domain-containing protein [Methylocystaceae bacterium]|nr:LytTR family transcriptional regulator DNA-binding domain-containing protein [Methylocystaceae bacterium]
MIVEYDPMLVSLSILIAISAAYTCFHLVDRLSVAHSLTWKLTLVAASFSIGGGIWATHFVGMLAFQLPINVAYDFQETLLSALIAIAFTAFALYLVTFRIPTLAKTFYSAVLMGCGIWMMHYIGMNAIIAQCIVQYDHLWAFIALLIGIAASFLALHLALSVKSRWEQLPAAVAMGLGIASLHYTGMYSTAFIATEAVPLNVTSSINASVMAVVITLAAFGIFGSTFLLATPSPRAPQDATEKAQERIKLKVRAASRTLYLEAEDIRFIKANGRYSDVTTEKATYLCDLSISTLDDMLTPYDFLRVHRSYLVNLAEIVSFSPNKDRGVITMNSVLGGQDIPISRAKLETVKNRLSL